MKTSWIQGSLKYKGLASIATLFLFASCDTKKHVEGQVFSNQVRTTLAKNLKKLPKINYIDHLGRVPSKEELELGRMLFNDVALSRNNDVSCASCHLSNHGFADGHSLSIGALGKGGPTGDTVGESFAKGVLGKDRAFGDDGHGFISREHMFRNTLSTVNVAYRAKSDNSAGLFHDGRFGSIRFQVLLPIHTSIEMCGTNPINLKNNLFKEGQGFFKNSVKLKHAHSFDYFSGIDLEKFNATPESIKGVPDFRGNATISVPGRNECTAIMVAKLRSIPKYVESFKKVYNQEVQDNLIAAAIASFVMTHVSKNTPYDKFIAGEDSLDESQLKGMVSFFTDVDKVTQVGKHRIKGAGCFKCHDAPLFGGTDFASLGVVSDPRSPLSKPFNVTNRSTSFFSRVRLQRGLAPNCHIEDINTTSDGYAPDIGRANGSFDSKDCFKFRVPPLRNVIETYPYFHHGSARAQGQNPQSWEDQSLKALEQVVRYHLRGPVDPKIFGQHNEGKAFFDEFFQKDFFIPFYRQNFVSLDDTKVQNVKRNKLSDAEVKDLINFIAYGLWDKDSVKVGDLGNDVSHPKSVLSGFSPTITRDEGTQTEIPPNSTLNK